MNRYISLLRGINVSGQKKIRMADLRELCEQQGFSKVQTYIQSGNLVFETEISDPDKIRADLEGWIRKQYGFDVPALVLRQADLENVRAGNPFLTRSDLEEKSLYVAFLYESPDMERVKMLEEFSLDDEYFALKEKWIYMYFPGGYGKAKQNNNFLEQKLNVQATSRNWKTVNTLFSMASLEE